MPAPDSQATAELTADQREWLQVRAYLRQHRRELDQAAAQLYPDTARFAGTSLLTRPEWVLDAPLSLDQVQLTWAAGARTSGVTGTEPVAEAVRPRRPDGTRYPSYAEAMRDLAAPRVFQDRSTYQLRTVALPGSRPGSNASAEEARLGFGPGSYFDGINLGEACAHELAAARLGTGAGTPLRDAVGDPCDPARRPMNLAVATLVIRHDTATGTADFPLHWRDPAKVGHAGGLYMVMPVGIFQSSAEPHQHQVNDFSLWRCLIREFAEELLGESEDHDQDVPIDYAAWPTADRLDQARRDGQVRAHVLGLGVDPLSLATDLLTVLTVDARWWDEVIGQVAATNGEGRLAHPEDADQARSGLFPFTAETVERLTTERPFQSAGAALLRHAWTHRAALLG
ncbi:MAG: transcriptional regulator [Actinomycetales bacterium]|nr:transcriptional regulator [Actinomycetales bacterium]